MYYILRYSQVLLLKPLGRSFSPGPLLRPLGRSFSPGPLLRPLGRSFSPGPLLRPLGRSFSPGPLLRPLGRSFSPGPLLRQQVFVSQTCQYIWNDWLLRPLFVSPEGGLIRETSLYNYSDIFI